MKRYVVRAKTILTIVSSHIIHRYQFTNECLRLQICHDCFATLEIVRANSPVKTPKNMEGISRSSPVFVVVVILKDESTEVKWIKIHNVNTEEEVVLSKPREQ
jgi:hypothetical protein